MVVIMVVMIANSFIMQMTLNLQRPQMVRITQDSQNLLVTLY